MDVSTKFSVALAAQVAAWQAKVDSRDKTITDLRAQLAAVPVAVDTGPAVDDADTAAVIAATPAPDEQPSATDMAAAGNHPDPSV